MTETEAAAAPAATTTPKKAKGASKAKPRTVPSHPKTSDMVNSAITNLKERGGSSLQAIKKYIASNYKVDVEKLAPFIKKYLKSAVTSGALVQTKGKGASGSFKLSATSSKTEKKAAPKKKTAGEKKPKKAAAKPAKKATEKKTKPKSPKKKAAAAKPKKAAGEKKAKPAKAKKAKTPKKEKKAKSPKKPKSPKPKKAGAKKAAAKK
jgi:histone H1/5